MLNALVKIAQEQFDINNDMKKVILALIKMDIKNKKQSFYFEERDEIGLSLIFWFERDGKNTNYGLAHTCDGTINGIEKYGPESFWITECKKIK